MPGTYKCPQGGNHSWQTKHTPDGVAYQECSKCGQARPK